LRVAMTVDPNLPVPPKLYGGIERIVDFLVRELSRRGHEVTLLAHPASDTPAKLIPYGVAPHRGFWARSRELWQVGSTLWRMASKIDVVHSFGRLAALVPILRRRGLAKIQSYQRDSVPWKSVRTAVKLAGRSLAFTGCSASVFRERAGQAADAGVWHCVFNGVDTSIYRPAFELPADAPLAFLGRLEEFKGAHHAVEIARRSGRKLAIAGNRVEEPAARKYFEERIAPHLDGDRVRYLGPVDDAAKNELLANAAALLMPIEWEEPFGIVMAEAFACGAPVIGFPRGSVPEVVRDGVNGFIRADAAAAAKAVELPPTIDRRAVRRDCEARFSHRVIVDRYERLYRETIEAARAA
jgi:glycosyltransferase involved in cell wall biosynthesis